MIVITVDLWPNGDESKKSQLGLATITNDGTGTDTSRNYYTKVYGRGRNPRLMLTGRVEGHNPKPISAWRTVMKCLIQAFQAEGGQG